MLNSLLDLTTPNILLIFFSLKGICRSTDSKIILASASADCSVKLWVARPGGNANNFRFRPPTDLLTELEHDSSVVSLDFDPYAFQNFSFVKQAT